MVYLFCSVSAWKSLHICKAQSSREAFCNRVVLQVLLKLCSEFAGIWPYAQVICGFLVFLSPSFWYSSVSGPGRERFLSQGLDGLPTLEVSLHTHTCEVTKLAHIDYWLWQCSCWSISWLYFLVKLANRKVLSHNQLVSSELDLGCFITLTDLGLASEWNYTLSSVFCHSVMSATVILWEIKKISSPKQTFQMHAASYL